MYAIERNDFDLETKKETAFVYGSFETYKKAEQDVKNNGFSQCDQNGKVYNKEEYGFDMYATIKEIV